MGFNKIESHSIFIFKARESIKENMDFCAYQWHCYDLFTTVLVEIHYLLRY